MRLNFPQNPPQNETPGQYTVTKQYTDNLIAQALTALRSTLASPGAGLTNPEAVRDYLRLQLAGEPHEVFAAIFMNSQHAVLAFEKIFQGSISGASVYPRELARLCLHHNAAAVILAHNHPSGNVEPSSADRTLTKRLKEALELIDVRVLDHFIVGGSKPMKILSMAEQGYV
jgi:DNA repair protein RadC